MFEMRTTITLDDELARALKQLAVDSGLSFKSVVNQTLRAGLASAARPPKPRRYRITPRHLGGVVPGIDLDRALRVADRLEEEELARKLELRK